MSAKSWSMRLDPEGIAIVMLPGNQTALTIEKTINATTDTFASFGDVVINLDKVIAIHPLNSFPGLEDAKSALGRISTASNGHSSDLQAIARVLDICGEVIK